LAYGNNLWNDLCVDHMNVAESTRVSDAATRIGQGFDDRRSWVTYDVGGWAVTLRADPRAPYDGADEMTLGLDMSDAGMGDAIDLAEAGGGITAEVLRSIPLGDARKVLRRLRSEFLTRYNRESYEIPARMRSLEDWALFARAFARSEASNPTQPVAHLSRATGLSINTINARLRRAQELDLLAAQTQTDAGHDWLVMTEKAKELLRGSDG
jgi:hypothetical protein